jgi:hypothetical protein
MFESGYKPEIITKRDKFACLEMLIPTGKGPMNNPKGWLDSTRSRGVCTYLGFRGFLQSLDSSQLGRPQFRRGGHSPASPYSLIRLTQLVSQNRSGTGGQEQRTASTIGACRHLLLPAHTSQKQPSWLTMALASGLVPASLHLPSGLILTVTM